MATVHIAHANVQDRALTGATLPSPDAVPMGEETLTSSGANAAAAYVTATAEGFWIVTVTGGNVRVAFGAEPDATSDPGWLVLDGQTRDFAVGAAGETCAVVDA